MQTIIYTIFIILIIGMLILIGATIFFFFHEEKNAVADAYGGDYETQKLSETTGLVIGTFGICEGTKVSLKKGQVCTVGKASNCDFQVMNNVVSRMHCTIKLLSNGTFEVTDFSTNGVYYNNYKLKKNTPFQVPNNSLLVIGNADNVIKLQTELKEI